jgi:hypothetical protein
MILITTTHKGHFSLSVRQKETPPAMPKKSLQRSQKAPLAHRQTTPETTHSRILQNRNDQKENRKKYNDKNYNKLDAQFLAVIYYRSGVKWGSILISCQGFYKTPRGSASSTSSSYCSSQPCILL